MGNIVLTEEQNTKPIKKKRDHRGNKNPHFNKPHSAESKASISKTQRERYRMIGELVKKGLENPLTEERIMQIVRETCADYLANNVKPDGNNEKKININL